MGWAWEGLGTFFPSLESLYVSYFVIYIITSHKGMVWNELAQVNTHTYTLLEVSVLGEQKAIQGRIAEIPPHRWPHCWVSFTCLNLPPTSSRDTAVSDFSDES